MTSEIDVLAQLIQEFDNDGGLNFNITEDNGANSGQIGGQSGSSIVRQSSGMVDEIPGLHVKGPVSNGSVPGHGGLHHTAETNRRGSLPKQGTKLKAIVDRMSGQFAKSTKRYLSDIFRCENSKEATKFCEQLRDDANRFGSPNFIIIRQHDSHVHVAHLCSYSGSHCRCHYIEKAKARAVIGKPYGRFRRKYANRIDSIDCTNILIYFIPKPGEKDFSFFVVAGQVEGQLCGDQILQQQGHLFDPNWKEQHPVETCAQTDQAELCTVEQLRAGPAETRTSRLQRSVDSTRSRKKRFPE